MDLGREKYCEPVCVEQHQGDNDSCTTLTEFERVASLRIEAIDLITYSYLI
jgi:hypothetical protein